MFSQPDFWLPIAMPVLFGFMALAFDTLVSQEGYHTVGISLLKLSSNTCFAYPAIDIWALTTAISAEVKAGNYSPRFIISLSILFFLIHMLLYAFCLLAIKKHQSAPPQKWFWRLLPPALAIICSIIASLLVMFERIKVWEVYYM